LTGTITSLDVGSLTITYEQEDDVSLGILTLLVKQCLNLAVPYFDIWVADKYFPIPEELFGIFKLSDLHLVNKNNYVEAGLTPTFLPLPSLEYTALPTFSAPLGWMTYEVDLGFISVEIDPNWLFDYSPMAMWLLTQYFAF